MLAGGFYPNPSAAAYNDFACGCKRRRAVQAGDRSRRFEAMTVLPITLTIAAAAALLNIWIAERVGRLRRQHRISIGTGGNELVETRMRAHSNFAEYTPVFLIL